MLEIFSLNRSYSRSSPPKCAVVLRSSPASFLVYLRFVVRNLERDLAILGFLAKSLSGTELRLYAVLILSSSSNSFSRMIAYCDYIGVRPFCCTFKSFKLLAYICLSELDDMSIIFDVDYDDF